ncbi:UNVERIFIED_CONTAM: hypothetical protein FKN15_029583 [Acipenser sinensis]
MVHTTTVPSFEAERRSLESAQYRKCVIIPECSLVELAVLIPLSISHHLITPSEQKVKTQELVYEKPVTVDRNTCNVDERVDLVFVSAGHRCGVMLGRQNHRQALLRCRGLVDETLRMEGAHLKTPEMYPI